MIIEIILLTQNTRKYILYDILSNFTPSNKTPQIDLNLYDSNYFFTLHIIILNKENGWNIQVQCRYSIVDGFDYQHILFKQGGIFERTDL